MQISALADPKRLDKLCSPGVHKTRGSPTLHGRSAHPASPQRASDLEDGGAPREPVVDGVDAHSPQHNGAARSVGSRCRERSASVTRYAFEDVRAALAKEWGLSLHRGGDMGDGKHDGRWDRTYSKTGYVVLGHFPRSGHSSQRYRSLGDVVQSWELTKALAEKRRR
jgi:hypothetical protein